jgi:hypothetical protein
LHVLGTPPAFVLSQDQTLQKKVDWLALRFVQFSRNEIIPFLISTFSWSG